MGPPRGGCADGGARPRGHGAPRLRGRRGRTVAGLTRYDERPEDHTPVDTEDLPATPTRDRNIPATAWRQAPRSLLDAGADLPGAPTAQYKRRIGDWLLWRAGPASGGDARYWAARPGALDEAMTFRLFPSGDGDGTGPDGSHHTRFRSWKESLLGR